MSGGEWNLRKSKDGRDSMIDDQADIVLGLVGHSEDKDGICAARPSTERK